MGKNMALLGACAGLGLALSLAPAPAAAQQNCSSLSLPANARPPYLQMSGPTSMTVRWDTAASNQGWVRYRQAPNGTWSQAINETTSRTGHEVQITGLSPNTKYEYQVGSGSQTTYQGAEHYFWTAPQAGSTKANLRILALGDAGGFGYGANDFRAQNTCRLLQAYEQWTQGQSTDLVLLLGDNAYNDGSAAQYSAQFNGFGPLWRHAAVWPAIGNHENNAAAYKNAFTLPTGGELGGAPSTTEEYYSFDYGNVHVVALNSDYSGGAGWNNTNLQTQVSWLRSDLQQNSQPWVIAFWHHPAYSHSASHGVSEGPMDAFRDQIVPILEEYGVDLVLAGHNHYYERTHYIHGLADGAGAANHAMLFEQNRTSYVVVDGAGTAPVYQKQVRMVGGQSAQVGTMYVMAGNASKVDYSVLPYAPRWVAFGNLGYTPSNQRDRQLTANEPGWFVFDITNDGRTLNAQYLSFLNPSITDAFTIEKPGAAGSRSPGAITGCACATATARPTAPETWGAVLLLLATLARLRGRRRPNRRRVFAPPPEIQEPASHAEERAR